jgi:hypothetical protein
MVKFPRGLARLVVRWNLSSRFQLMTALSGRLLATRASSRASRCCPLRSIFSMRPASCTLSLHQGSSSRAQRRALASSFALNSAAASSLHAGGSSGGGLRSGGGLDCAGLDRVCWGLAGWGGRPGLPEARGGGPRGRDWVTVVAWRNANLVRLGEARESSGSMCRSRSP